MTSSSILWTRQEVTNATLGGPVTFLISFGPVGVGGALTSIEFPALFAGEFFEAGNAQPIATTIAGPKGYASSTFVFPISAVLSGLNICWQAFDLTRFRFSTPAPIQFL